VLGQDKLVVKGLQRWHDVPAAVVPNVNPNGFGLMGNTTPQRDKTEVVGSFLQTGDRHEVRVVRHCSASPQ